MQDNNRIKMSITLSPSLPTLHGTILRPLDLKLGSSRRGSQVQELTIWEDREVLYFNPSLVNLFWELVKYSSFSECWWVWTLSKQHLVTMWIGHINLPKCTIFLVVDQSLTLLRSSHWCVRDLRLWLSEKTVREPGQVVCTTGRKKPWRTGRVTRRSQKKRRKDWDGWGIPDVERSKNRQG